MSEETAPKFWQGTNFWVALFMAVGGLWGGIQETDVNAVIGPVFGLVGGVFLLREKIKSAVINWKEWALSKNTWNYFFAALAAIVPTLPAGLGDKLSELLTAFAGKNWTAVITGVISLATIIYFWITGGKAAKKA
jgi:hypothetical protein